MRQAAEAAQAALVARLRVEQADLARQNGARRVERASDLVARAQQLAQSVGQTVTELRAAAMTVVAIAQSQRDVLLGLGFRAQRSAEIYTLRDEAEGVLLDSGYLHPDRERDYTETYLGDAEIITFYEQAWGQFTYASRMQAEYEAYFDGHDLGVTIRRFSFDDPAVVSAFVTDRRIDFSVTPEVLPADDLEAKIQNVAVALPGATSPSGIVTCEVTHGPVYRQRRVDGSTSVQVLAPHTATVTAPVTPLQLDGVDVSPGAPLTTPQTVPFWGRGVLGEWSVVVPESETVLHGVDTSTVTAVQVWIVYQFRRIG